VMYTEIYRKHFKLGMSFEQFHEAYADHLAQKLVNMGLSTLETAILNWKDALPDEKDEKAVVIDFSPELKAYTKPVADCIKGRVQKVKVIDYLKDNGRHTIALEGIVNPFSSMEHGAIPEDIIMELAELRLGKPTQRRMMKDQGFKNGSYFGLLAASHGLVKDGGLYSLGDPLLTVPKHPSLSIIFLYPNGQPPSLRGYSLNEILSLLSHQSQIPNGMSL